MFGTRYDRRRFADHGLKHVDLYFLDGSCPDKEACNWAWDRVALIVGQCWLGFLIVKGSKKSSKLADSCVELKYCKLEVETCHGSSLQQLDNLHEFVSFSFLGFSNTSQARLLNWEPGVILPKATLLTQLPDTRLFRSSFTSWRTNRVQWLFTARCRHVGIAGIATICLRITAVSRKVTTGHFAKHVGEFRACAFVHMSDMSASFQFKRQKAATSHCAIHDCLMFRDLRCWHTCERTWVNALSIGSNRWPRQAWDGQDRWLASTPGGTDGFSWSWHIAKHFVDWANPRVSIGPTAAWYSVMFYSKIYCMSWSYTYLHMHTASSQPM